MLPSFCIVDFLNCKIRSICSAIGLVYGRKSVLCNISIRFSIYTCGKLLVFRIKILDRKNVIQHGRKGRQKCINYNHKFKKMNFEVLCFIVGRVKGYEKIIIAYVIKHKMIIWMKKEIYLRQRLRYNLP